VDDEQALLDLARAAAAGQLEQIVRSYRSCLARTADEQLAYDTRSLSWHWSDDGSLCLRGRLPAEQGALLVRALEQARDALGPPPPEVEDASAEARHDHDVSPVQSRNAD